MTTDYLIPIIIAGPTASGKSQLAMRLAKKFDGEIICADSRQFYSGMELGTACPSGEDQNKIRHHGYGAFDPNDHKIDAGSFVDFAHKTIDDIRVRKKRPIIVGGTGLYLRALAYGLSDVPPSDQSVVKDLEARADSEGNDALHSYLASIDPLTAERIMRTDRYRIIRALEIFTITGKKPSDLRQSFAQKAPKLRAHWIYKKPKRDELMKKIAQRVDEMFYMGLIEEACRLRQKLDQDHWALSVMGFKEALMCKDGMLSLADAKSLVTIRHRQYAKRQFTWFSKETLYRFAIS